LAGQLQARGRRKDRRAAELIQKALVGEAGRIDGVGPWGLKVYPTQICWIISGWWFGTFFIFPYTLGIIIPTDKYFSEGL
jgi:hypothetical protein